MKPLHKIFIFCLFLSACDSKITPLTSLVRDQGAARLLKQEKTELALDQYLKILESSPSEPAVHSNIGVLLGQIQKPDEALKSYLLALQLAQDKKDAHAEFAIRFNLGTYYGALKKIPEALENYQAALEIVPNSIETKTNIELLIQSDQKNKQQNKDNKKDENKDQKQDGEGQDNKKDGDDQKKDKEQDQKESDKGENEKDKKDSKENKDYKGNAKYKPRPFQGEQLSEGDVKKILGELRNQEQKIRANFDKKERKEQKNGKDW